MSGLRGFGLGSGLGLGVMTASLARRLGGMIGPGIRASGLLPGATSVEAGTSAVRVVPAVASVIVGPGVELDGPTRRRLGRVATTR